MNTPRSSQCYNVFSTVSRRRSACPLVCRERSVARWSHTPDVVLRWHPGSGAPVPEGRAAHSLRTEESAGRDRTLGVRVDGTGEHGDTPCFTDLVMLTERAIAAFTARRAVQLTYRSRVSTSRTHGNCAPAPTPRRAGLPARRGTAPGTSARGLVLSGRLDSATLATAAHRAGASPRCGPSGSLSREPSAPSSSSSRRDR